MADSQPISSAQLLAALHWRYAVKQFDPAKKIPADTWAALEEALVLAPSSMGLQPWKFLVVTNPAVKEQLHAVSFKNLQPLTCSHLVVFALRKDLDAAHIARFVNLTAEKLGVDPASLDGLRKMQEGYVARTAEAGTLNTIQGHQVFIALGQFMTAAALLGVDTCALGGIQTDKYDEILRLAGTPYTTLVACAAGYRSSEDKYAARPKIRFPAEEIIVHI